MNDAACGGIRRRQERKTEGPRPGRARFHVMKQWARWAGTGLAGLWLAAGAAGAAEEPFRPEFTLEDCIAIGLREAAPARNAQRDREIAGTRIGQVRAQVLPQLKATGNYTRLDETPAYEFDGDTVAMGREDNYAAGAEVSQLLFSGGSVGAALDAAKLYRDIADIRVRAVNNEVERDVRTGFVDILLQDEQVQVQEASLAQLEELLAQAEARRRQETASDYDVLVAQVKVANNRPLLIAARKQADLARAAFRSLLHLDAAEFTLAGELAYVPEERPLEDWQARGLAERPELQELRLFLELRQAEIRSEQGGYWPQIRAFGNWQERNPPEGSALDEWDAGWTAGVAAEWDLFDGLLRRNRIAEKRLELDKARETLGEAERRVALEIQTQYLELQQAAETVAASQDTVAQAEKGLEIASARYENGLATYLDYTDANLALNIARLTRLQALHDHMAAQARLRQAAGEGVSTGEQP